MTKEHCKNLLECKDTYDEYSRLKWFIKTLNFVLPLAFIDTNDWGSNTRPSTYVHNKNNRFKMRRYSRCAVSDVVKAVKFYNKD